MSERPPVLPDENLLVIPAESLGELMPRRGGTAPDPPPRLDPSARARMAERAESAGVEIENALRHPDSDPRAVEAARAYLAGRPDPLGAAVVAFAVHGRQAGEGDDTVPKWIDAWAAEHGLAFAACACAELDGLSRPGRDRRHKNAVRADGWSDADAYWAAGRVGRRMRSLLAVAGEAEYAEAVDRLAAHRRTPQQRRIVSFLVPERQDWVNECCDEPPERGDDHSHGAELLWCSVGSMEHVARLRTRGWARFDEHERSPRVLLTVLDALGPQAAPLLASALDDAHELAGQEWRRYMLGPGYDEAARSAILRALALLPGDEAYRIVGRRLDLPGALPALVTMLGRFPVRGLRLLGEMVDGGGEHADPAARLLAWHLRTRPELSDRVPDLSERARTAIGAIEARRVTEADPGMVPKAFRKSGEAAVPEWAPLALLPQVLLRERERALPDAATGHLLAALGKASPKRAPAAALKAALAELDEGSLAEFGRALFERWRVSGDGARAGWAQLSWTGDDETMRRLGALARSWTGQDGIKLPLDLLDVLAGSGSDVAVIQLHLVADKARPKRLKKKAGKLLARVAAARGLTLDELGDRMVPDFGLVAAAPGQPPGMTLDYGPRTFRVGFDEQLRPVVTDDAGRLRKALPKPGAKDDPVLAPAAHRSFTGLKKDVRAVAADQIRRMERAMVAQRRWTPEEFRRLLAGHPLLWHLVRRLVWLHRDGGKDTPFRMAEDHTFADAADEVWTLPDSGEVRIAHPLHLGDALPVWSQTLADYEIVQPFPQVGRPTHAFTEEERGGRVLDRFSGVRAGVGGVLRLLQSEGWRGVAIGDMGILGEFVWEEPGGRVITLDVSPGITPWDPAGEEVQTLGAVRIAGSEADRSGASGARFGDLDDITASEFLLALHSLTHTG